MIHDFILFILIIEHEVIGIFQLDKVLFVRNVNCMHMHLLNDFFKRSKVDIYSHRQSDIFILLKENEMSFS